MIFLFFPCLGQYHDTDRGMNIEISIARFNNRVPESSTKLDTTLERQNSVWKEDVVHTWKLPAVLTTLEAYEICIRMPACNSLFPLNKSVLKCAIDSLSTRKHNRSSTTYVNVFAIIYLPIQFEREKHGDRIFLQSFFTLHVLMTHAALNSH